MVAHIEKKEKLVAPLAGALSTAKLPKTRRRKRPTLDRPPFLRPRVSHPAYISLWRCSQSDCCLQTRTTPPRIIGCVILLFTFIETHRRLSSKTAHADVEEEPLKSERCVTLKSCATPLGGHLATGLQQRCRSVMRLRKCIQRILPCTSILDSLIHSL